jgi:DNA-directed RNA polymerase
MDACHLMMTLHNAFSKGVRSFACIHDDYGTHAADTEDLQAAIREAFIQLYGENNPLLDFKISNESQYGLTLPDLPSPGTLDINKIKDSLYFFG